MSVNSMTGFGKAEGQIGASYFNIELKTVNHRYLDVRFRTPASLSQFEISLTEILRDQLERGSVDITMKQKVMPSAGVKAEPTVPGTCRFVVDELAARSL